MSQHSTFFCQLTLHKIIEQLGWPDESNCLVVNNLIKISLRNNQLVFHQWDSTTNTEIKELSFEALGPYCTYSLQQSLLERLQQKFEDEQFNKYLKSIGLPPRRLQERKGYPYLEKNIRL